MNERARRRSAVAALMLGGGLMAAIAVVHAVKLAGETIGAVRRLTRETAEERRLETYGACGARGYGYLEGVVRHLPDPHAVPLVRYHGYDRFGALTLPFERDRVDPRILVGINLRDEDLSEQPIACRRLRGAGNSSSWLAQPDADFDSLVGFRFGVAPDSPPAARVDVALYDTPRRLRQLARWQVPIPPGAAAATGAVTIRLDAPFSPLWVHNRSIGLLLDVNGAPLEAVDLLAISVDARDFVPVHRDGGCTTSVRTDLVAALREPHGPWHDWIDALSTRK